MKGYGRTVAAWLGIMAPIYALIAFIGGQWNPADWYVMVRALFGAIGFLVAIPATLWGYEQ